MGHGEQGGAQEEVGYLGLSVEPGQSKGAGRGLVQQMTNSRKAVLHFAKSNKNLLTVARDSFVERGLRAFVIGPIATARKDRKRQTRTDRPGAAVPIE